MNKSCCKDQPSTTNNKRQRRLRKLGKSTVLVEAAVTHIKVEYRFEHGKTHFHFLGHRFEPSRVRELMIHERASSYSIPRCLQSLMEVFCWHFGQ